MPTITNVKVVIYDHVIQSHFTPAGLVGLNAGSVGHAAEGAAKAFAPFDTGELEASIRAGHHPGGGLYYNLFLNANAPHAATQEHGATGPIISSRGPGKMMHLRPGRGYPALVLPKVKGHPGIHYLSRGMAAGLSSHGYPVSSVQLRRGQDIQRRL